MPRYPTRGEPNGSHRERGAALAEMAAARSNGNRGRRAALVSERTVIWAAPL